jgi:hypothetical protein
MVGIYKSLTDTGIKELDLKFLSGNICFEFVVQCLYSARQIFLILLKLIVHTSTLSKYYALAEHVHKNC